MATKIRPIVFRINEPEGFVMNASNAIYTQSGTSIYVAWEGPAYPDAYNGNGKHYILVNNNVDTTLLSKLSQLMYATTNNSGGPSAISQEYMQVPGTSTGVLDNNAVPLEYGYGKFLEIAFNNIQSSTALEEVQAYMANFTLTILDP